MLLTLPTVTGALGTCMAWPMATASAPIWCLSEDFWNSTVPCLASGAAEKFSVRESKKVRIN